MDGLVTEIITGNVAGSFASMEHLVTCCPVETVVIVTLTHWQQLKFIEVYIAWVNSHKKANKCHEERRNNHIMFDFIIGSFCLHWGELWVGIILFFEAK